MGLGFNLFKLILRHGPHFMSFSTYAACCCSCSSLLCSLSFACSVYKSKQQTQFDKQEIVTRDREDIKDKLWNNSVKYFY